MYDQFQSVKNEDEWNSISVVDFTHVQGVTCQNHNISARDARLGVLQSHDGGHDGRQAVVILGSFLGRLLHGVTATATSGIGVALLQSPHH